MAMGVPLRIRHTAFEQVIGPYRDRDLLALVHAQTNDLGIHDRAAFDASGFFDNARVALRPVSAIHRE
jgi:hypothetical protein